jgi:ribosomal protein S1
MNKISTQTIEIVNPENPLESKKVVVPVTRKMEILSREPYVVELLKKYETSFNSEDLDVISSYDENSYKGICSGQIDRLDDEKGLADISLSKKHSTVVNFNSKDTTITGKEMGVGDVIEVVVTKQHGKLFADAASKTAQMERLRIELINQIDSPTSAYSGVVKEIVFNGAKVFNGFIVDINGVKCFMPGSESDVVPLEDYNTLVGQTMYVMPIAKVKDSIVVSHKEFLNRKKNAVLSDLMDLDKNSVAQGIVSSVKSFGVFIIIGECVPTLLSVSEMNSITEDKFKNGQLKVGDPIDFYVESVVDGRVTITQTNSKSEGWSNLKATVDNDNKYVLKGVIKNTFENGIVVSAPNFNNITFFLSRKVVDMDNVEVGKEIELGVSSVDTAKKTVRIITE